MEAETGRNEATTSLRVTTVSSLVAAYLAHNHVKLEDVPGVFAAFEQQVDRLFDPKAVSAEAAPAEKPQPAVPIRKSVTPDYIISLFDGRRMKSLKRYLRTQHNMTPKDYIAFWGLPHDYPMTAPNYAARRSELAKQIGLGRGGRRGAASADAKPKAAPKAAPKARKSAPAAAANA